MCSFRHSSARPYEDTALMSSQCAQLHTHGVYPVFTACLFVVLSFCAYVVVLSFPALSISLRSHAHLWEIHLNRMFLDCWRANHGPAHELFASSFRATIFRLYMSDVCGLHGPPTQQTEREIERK